MTVCASGSLHAPDIDVTPLQQLGLHSCWLTMLQCTNTSLTAEASHHCPCLIRCAVSCSSLLNCRRPGKGTVTCDVSSGASVNLNAARQQVALHSQLIHNMYICKHGLVPGQACRQVAGLSGGFETHCLPVQKHNPVLQSVEGPGSPRCQNQALRVDAGKHM